ITSGGLGPTKDDVTKTALCSYFQSDLIFNQSIYDDLVARYTRNNRPLNLLNRDQAMVPAVAEVITNDVGTAPIFWIEKDGKVLVTFPGVPSEMRYMFEKVLLPRFIEKFSGGHISRTILQVIGIPESDLALKLTDVENNIEAAITDS